MADADKPCNGLVSLRKPGRGGILENDGLFGRSSCADEPRGVRDKYIAPCLWYLYLYDDPCLLL